MNNENYNWEESDFMQAFAVICFFIFALCVFGYLIAIVTMR